MASRPITLVWTVGGRIGGAAIVLALTFLYGTLTVALPQTRASIGQSRHPASEIDCLARREAVWVDVEGGSSACLDFVASARGGDGGEAIVALMPPITAMAGPMDGNFPTDRPNVMPDEASVAGLWSELARTRFVFITSPRNAKPGSRAEVALMSAALDRLKSRLGVRRLHLVGLGATGNLAATLAIRRNDIGCAVMGGAWLSERDRLAETGEIFPPARLRAANDPIAELTAARPGAGVKLVDLVDPADPDTPASAVDAFARAAAARGLRLDRIGLPVFTSGERRMRATLLAALTCVTGASQAEILARSAPSALPPIVPSTRLAIGDLIVPPGPQPVQPTAQDRRQIAPPGSARAQADTFSRADLLNGTTIDAAACARLPFAVWVTSLGPPDCVRYYYSEAGGRGARALLFLNGDFTTRGLDGLPAADPDYARIGPDDLQHVADVRSRDYGGPMIYLARPGTLGSSGLESQVRHSPREVALVSAALSEIKRRHGIATFDLIGHSGGGLLVGALAAERADIGCAISSSGVLATNAWTSDRLKLPPSNSGFLYDPIDHVADIRPGPDFRFIILTDDSDATVPPASTRLYLAALDAGGIPYLHLALSASDVAHHDLALHGFRAAIACAHGRSDAEIAGILQRTIVTNRHMSELSPIGDMPELTPAGDVPDHHAPVDAGASGSTPPSPKSIR